MSERAIRDRGRSIRSVTAVGSVVALMFALTACGGDDESAGKSYALVPSTEAAGSTVPEKAGSPASKDATLCALAEEMNRQQSFPTVDQLTEYQELAPAAIEDAVAIAAPAFIAAGGDAMKFFVALADDDVEGALVEINAWETENCGIDHDGGPGGPLEGGATREREDGATVVDVVATDYAFRIGGDAIAPGRTSLVLTNKGEEAHFMQLFKLAKGATMKQVMASDEGGSGLIDGSWDSGVAAPGGEDEEFLTLDLEPGTYGVSCYISTADGTPHASLGMTAEFTVS